MPELTRTPKRDDAAMLPEPVPGKPGVFTVDGTWGTLTPITLPGGVETVGELEVIEHIKAGDPIIDTRRDKFVEQGSIPTAIAIDHNEIVSRIDELNPEAVTVMYCNGPQCAATPDAVSALLDAGYPAAQLRYYRGGIHDWVTLGLPLVS
jgi:rhodanese-related sulfurtransferase